VHDDLRAGKRHLTDLLEQRGKVGDAIAEINLENDVVTRALKGALKNKEDVTVQHDLLQLELKKLRDVLNSRLEEVYGLENRKFHLARSIEERLGEIAANREVLKGEIKVSEEERHRVALELRERELKVSILVKKFEILSDVVTAELGGEGERRTPAYYVVMRAQEREELQAQGDALDARIQKLEGEVRALEATLAKLNLKNDKLRTGFARVDASSKEFSQKMELEAVRRGGGGGANDLET
jgi:coiled-coil domain-containing protein 39